MRQAAERVNEAIAAYVVEPTPHRWSGAEYRRVSDLGLFDGKRVELIEGVVIEMPAMGRPHWVACQLAADALRGAFGSGFFVTTNLPAYLDEYSEPEPDVAVLAGDPRAYAGSNPTIPLLIVEISDSSLNFDRTTKARLYADHGVLDYWLIDIRNRTVEVRRNPVADGDRPGGRRYDRVEMLDDTQTLSPLAAPDAVIAIRDLLP